MNTNLGWKKKVLEKIKVSDLLAELLVANGINHVFIVSGGASIHLLHSFESTQGIAPVPMHHEQAAAMAADGYARAGGGLGCAAATSGPGATNLITGIAGAWFDSIPCLFISGQVATFRLKGKLKVRQLGFQETEIVPMVRKITKFAIQIKRKIDVVSNTQLAIDVAKAPRPGPVLIDIPDDIQRDYIEKSPVSRLVDNMVVEGNFIQTILLNNKIKHINELINASSRPLIIFGAGANYSEIEESCKKLVDTLGIPTLVTWRAKDLISSDCKYLIGTFGTHGTRAGNFIVQNSDLVIVLGSRLSSRETGGNLRDWARDAKLVHVDIDKFESKKLQKQGKEPILVVNADLRKFIPDLLNSLSVNLPLSSFTNWTSWAQEVKSKFKYKISDQESSSLSGYDFYLILNQYVSKSEQIFLDTGCTVAWAMQCFKVTDSIKLFHDCNNTAMGWALPAAIGGAIRNPLISTTCIAGDGSFMMNLQELSTSKLYSPNLKIIILNNSGYGMVRQTEDQWLSGKHIGTDQRNGDIIFPDFCKLAESFGLNSFKAKDQRELRSGLKSMYIDNNINLLEVVIDPSSKVVPQSRFGYPIEDSEPALSLMDMEENMLIPLLPISKESRL